VFDVHLSDDRAVRDRTGVKLARQFPNLPRVLWTREDEDTALGVDALKEGIDVALKSRGVNGLIESVRSALGRRVFFIHGHDPLKDTVFLFLRVLKLKPIVLAEQPSGARTIIELLERHAGVDCAVALLTPDDEGRRRLPTETLKPRARQNVVFELGFFSAAVGRDKLFLLCDDTIERPSDYSGVRYIPLDSANQWQTQLVAALMGAGLRVSAV
jgi:predicted nucleotide-binding protein